MSLMNILAEVMGGDTIGQVSRQLGVDENTAQRAVSSALPLLLGALARNSSSPEGANALDRALGRDHDGSILDQVGDFLGGGGNAGMGSAILGHVLGGRQSTIESGVSRMSGLDPAMVGQLLAMLAPLVMGVLGREKQRQGLDASGIAGILGQERAAFERHSPQAMGLLGLLDQDGDGNIMDDVANIGAGLLGAFLKNRR